MYKSNSSFHRCLGVRGSNQPLQICQFDYLDKVQLWLLSKLTGNRFEVRYYSHKVRKAIN